MFNNGLMGENTKRMKVKTMTKMDIPKKIHILQLVQPINHLRRYGNNKIIPVISIQKLLKTSFSLRNQI